jgi:tetratricopeptide (TPR) repeat protein
MAGRKNRRTTRIAKKIWSGMILDMKFFLTVAVIIFVSLTSVRAQQEADEKYLDIYSLIQSAENLAGTGETRDAVVGLADAQVQLQKFQKLYPTWNPDIVAYRLNDIAAKMSAMKGQSAPKPAAGATTPANDPNGKLRSEVNDLQAQLQNMQTENNSLQAKLKEALASQPAAVDATELAKAQNLIKELTKQNDLLKSRPASDTNALASKAELEAYVQKFAAERARAQKLATENAELLKKLSSSAVPDEAALAALRVENEKLKSQITSFNAASAKLPDYDRVVAELRDARTTIAQLQTTVTIVSLEKSALETKVTSLNTRVNVLTAEVSELRRANYDARIRDLTEQKAELERKLAAAQKAPTQITVKDNTAEQIAKLNDEVKSLRSRLNVAETKPIPYTSEELALFQQPAPKRNKIDVEPMKKSVSQLPTGTSELVASAQDHFAKHEFEEAEADYDKILEKDPNNGLVLANLATIELQANKLDEAEKHIRAALDQNPNDAYNLSTYGYLLFRQEKFKDALVPLSHASELDPENPEVQNYLGVTLSHLGQRAQGETALRKAIQIKPDYAPAHNNLAVMYLSQEPSYPRLARMHYQKALIAGQPHNPDLEKMLADKGAPLETSGEAAPK